MAFSTVIALSLFAILPPDDLVQGIERVVLKKGRDGGTAWFHPRACRLPGRDPVVLMTMQSITGSDVFGHVHWLRYENGKWTEPRPIPGLGRRAHADGKQEGVCDVVPEAHPQTGAILAIGHNVFYRNNRLMRPQPPRRPVYVVGNRKGEWSRPRPLLWDDPRGKFIYTCNCAQRITLANGNVLIPITFGAASNQPRSVATLLCSFNGKELKVLKVSNELKGKVRRGLLEPSLTKWNGTCYMTIRAEDGRGYVTTSNNGLTWAEKVPWKWDNGEPLTMSTTQQRWLPHSDALYLVYTRKAKNNVNVFRWRAPLFMAKVDPKNLRLIRATERVVFPLIGNGIKNPKGVARMGNFHTVAVTPTESWVTVGETLPSQKYRGNLLQAKIKWSRPNKRLKTDH